MPQSALGDGFGGGPNSAASFPIEASAAAVCDRAQATFRPRLPRKCPCRSLAELVPRAAWSIRPGAVARRLRRLAIAAEAASTPYRVELPPLSGHRLHNHALDAVVIRHADLRLYAFAGQRFLRRSFIANQPTRSRARIN